jgi:hypothetical protein
VCEKALGVLKRCARSDVFLSLGSLAGYTPTDLTDYTTVVHTTTITVNKAVSTTTILSQAPNPSLVGQAVLISVNVTGTGVPTGTVTVSGGGVNCKATLSAGVGSCSLTFTTAGTKTVTASYSGDTDFKTSTSAKVTQVVQK